MIKNISVIFSLLYIECDQCRQEMAVLGGECQIRAEISATSLTNGLQQPSPALTINHQTNWRHNKLYIFLCISFYYVLEQKSVHFVRCASCLPTQIPSFVRYFIFHMLNASKFTKDLIISVFHNKSL